MTTMTVVEFERFAMLLTQGINPDHFPDAVLLMEHIQHCARQAVARGLAEQEPRRDLRGLPYQKPSESGMEALRASFPVERISKAVADRLGLDWSETTHDAYIHGTQSVVETIRAVIEAMRAASEETLAAGAQAMAGPSAKGQDYCNGIPTIWAAMLESILSSPKPPAA